jgi:hypothetical protein
MSEIECQFYAFKRSSMKKMVPQTAKEKRVARIVFWCFAPLMFAGFMRIFMLVFYFIYGSLLIWILGRQYQGIVTVAAVVTSVGFAVATVVYLYRQYVVHILGKP